jgi:hypothetical protein
VSFSLSQDGVEDVLDIIGDIDHITQQMKRALPDNYRAMLAMLTDHFGITLPQEYVYDICPMCYFVYRCESATCSSCPECDEPRFGEDGKARQQFYYRSLSCWVKTMFSTSAIASKVSYHASHRNNNGEICDFQDGEVYAKAMQDRRFANEPRNLLLGLVTDGFLPFADDKKYSCWPLVITCYNFPPWARYLLGMTTLLGVVPGSRLDGSKLNLQPFLQILVDEILFIDTVGLEVYDKHKGEYFTCHVKLVQSLSDMRGIDKLLDLTSVPATYPCFFCWIKGFKAGGQRGKMIYPGHYTMLPEGHPLRAVLAKLNCPPCPQCAPHRAEQDPNSLMVPALRTVADISQGLKAPSQQGSCIGEPIIGKYTNWEAGVDVTGISYEDAAELLDGGIRKRGCDAGSSRYGTEGAGPSCRKVPRTSGGRRKGARVENDDLSDGECNGSDGDNQSSCGEDDEFPDVPEDKEAEDVPLPARLALCCLPWFDTQLHVGYDVMHTVGGVVKDTALRLLTSARVSDGMLAYERTANHRFLSSKPWEATQQQLDFMQTLLANVVEASPSRMTGSRFLRLLSRNKKQKSHALMVFASSMGMYVLAALYGSGQCNPQQEAIGRLLIVCSALQAKTWTKEKVEEVRSQVLMAICCVEAYLPATELDLKLHALVHLPDKILKTGPLWVTSMFVYESMWGHFGRWSRNQCHLELSMLRSFMSFEVAYHAYWDNPEKFAFSEVSKFTEKLHKMAALYQVPRLLASNRGVTISLFGAGQTRRGQHHERVLILNYIADYSPGGNEVEAAWDR